MQFVRGEAGRFYLHQVDRDYALSRLVEGEPEDRDVEPPLLTRYALRHRAAEYFKETRKPSDSWKSLDDLVPQLTEFELRLAGEDYDAAASVLIEIDYDYLSLWGHYRMLVDRYERLQGRLTDPYLEWGSTTGLGNAYSWTGQFQKAIYCLGKALAMARKRKEKPLEARSLVNLGGVYGDMGDQAKAIELVELSLSLYVDLGDKSGEAAVRGNLANRFSDLGRWAEAIDQYERAITLDKDVGDYQGECIDKYNIAHVYSALLENAKASTLAEDARKMALSIDYRLIEIGATCLQAEFMVREGRFEDAIRLFEESIRTADEANAVQFQMSARRELAIACLLAKDLPRARTAADEAAKYRYPRFYAVTLAVGGVVALRQGDTAAARTTFESALSEAEKQLAGAAKSYASAYAKALALAGLALCRNAALATDAAEAYRDARAISAAPGIVMEKLQILDALAVADSIGTLKPVRAAAAGEG